ncbi:hypothetical protein CA984_32715 [Streptosporangium minutum]|uniref:M23ase beta-sheet core domain-containing protein n=2 Tax=Streptosporangium minutum TaxID=569862 RepID=A0A243RAN3_9ACTN|nr:hypothetical protein CA984_32715 [Streptosporangium minutum]
MRPFVSIRSRQAGISHLIRARTTAVAALIVLTGSLANLPAHAAAPASLSVLQGVPAAPALQLPFPCDQQWRLDTWGHAPALDMVKEPDQQGTEGATLVAPASGTVNQSYYHSNAGNVIQINHGGGWFTTYLHLQSRAVGVGAGVAQGTLIGRVGRTGPTSNNHPHLHFELGYDSNGNGEASWGYSGAERVRPAFNGVTYGGGDNQTHRNVTSRNCGTSSGRVYEASSANGWQSLPTGISGVSGSALAVGNVDGTKFIYTVVDGKVYEASSANGWQSLPTGISGVSGSALAVGNVDGTKFIYTVVDGKVYEASSANGWQNLPTGISGVSGSALATVNVNGTKFIYTVVDGKVYEASSANGWQNLPTGISGVSGSALATVNVDGTKFIYTVVDGKVYEASSANGWQNLPTGISGVSGSALAVGNVNGTKFIYTVVDGKVYEASSANGWQNLPTGISGVSGSALATVNVNGTKFIYTV